MAANDKHFFVKPLIWALVIAPFFFIACPLAQTQAQTPTPTAPNLSKQDGADPSATSPSESPPANHLTSQSATQAASQRIPDPARIDAQFKQALTLMASDPEQAAALLRTLHEQTRAIRIQLELARSLYLAGHLDEAKAEFIALINQPIPITVRDKVEWYLSEIQKRDSVKVILGLYQDSNPGYITSARTVSIFGQTLSYQPAQNTNAETGLAVGLEAERELIPQSGFFAQANLNTATYATNAFNKQDIDVSFVKRWQGYDYKDLRFGYDTFFYGGTVLFTYPYASSRWVFNLPNQDYYGFFIKGGPMNYPTYTYLTGSQTLINVFYNHNITNNLTAYVETGADRTPATQAAYSSYGAYGTIGSQIAHDPTNIQVNLKATFSQRNYWDSDPLWGQVRRDGGRLYTASITKRDLYILGMRPSIDIVHQSNNSDIPFFSYTKVFGGLFLKNVY